MTLTVLKFSRTNMLALYVDKGIRLGKHSCDVIYSDSLEKNGPKKYQLGGDFIRTVVQFSSRNGMAPSMF